MYPTLLYKIKRQIEQVECMHEYGAFEYHHSSRIIIVVLFVLVALKIIEAA